jgi:putrescine transport system substrate-binding protein
MANGDICISTGYSGDTVQARKRAKEANNGVVIRYVIPKEGSMLWITVLAIPRDALHAANAHLFINYMMTPQVMGDITNSVGFANAIPDASPFTILIWDAPMTGSDRLLPDAVDTRGIRPGELLVLPRFEPQCDQGEGLS